MANTTVATQAGIAVCRTRRLVPHPEMRDQRADQNGVGAGIGSYSQPEKVGTVLPQQGAVHVDDKNAYDQHGDDDAEPATETEEQRRHRWPHQIKLLLHRERPHMPHPRDESSRTVSICISQLR